MDNQGMGPDTVTTRRAETDDLPGLMQLQLQSYEASLQEPASLFEQIIGASPATCLVAEHASVMAGYLLCIPSPMISSVSGQALLLLSGSETALYLHDMCVSAAHRNKGIGRLLFDALTAHLES